MKQNKNFKKSIVPEINAAILGISSQDWDSVKTTDSLEHAISIMKNKNYDILPITNKNGETKEFYHTKKWGNYDKNNIERLQINQTEKVYYLTDIKDLINKFVSDKRYYYFLTDYKEIVGLISIVNLNSKSTYLYLYNLLIELETDLGYWISTLFTDEEIDNILHEKKNFSNQNNNFQQDKSKGINNRLVEYIYLRDMFDLIINENKYKMLGYEKDIFIKLSKFICHKRNLVSHPVNPTNIDIAEDFLDFITKTEELHSKIVDAQLLTFYYKTDYIVNVPKIIIKINEKNDDLNKLLKENNTLEWAYITAYNPMSEKKTENENITANKKLFNDIKEYKVFEGEGLGKDKTWESEKSFLILGINRQKAIELGRKYLQRAIVFGVIDKPAELIILF